MNMKKILNSSKILSIICIFIIIFLLSTTSVSEASSTNLNYHDLSSFYTNKTYNNIFYVRYEINDIIQTLNKKEVVEFYQQFTKNKKIAEIIINKCLMYNIPVNIGFALAWEESRFNPYAVNRNNNDGTVDKGLFQLNSAYHRFPDEKLFDPVFNSDRALPFLLEMININNNNMTLALYCYNAGYNRIVIQQVIPQSTQNHIINILAYEDMLNIKFTKWLNDI